MFTIWFYAIGSVLVVSLISLVGLVAFSLDEARLRRMLFILVALAAGALFGDVIIHILPEIFATGQNNLAAASGVLSGILIFFILEKFLHWRHSHRVDECLNVSHQHHIQPVGYLNLLADGLHNLIDGAIIGASFLVSPGLGLATTLAVILHEIPQEIGDFGILIQAGFSRRRAIIWNALSASLALIGVILVLVFGTVARQVTGLVLALAAGGFLYIAGSDLVPELHKTTEPKKSLAQFAAIILGIVMMFFLSFVE